MGVNEIIDEYCQITGRPKFTITIDEFLKLKQVLGDVRNQKAPTQAMNEQMVFAVENQNLPSKKDEQNEKAIESTPIFLKEEGLNKQKLSPMTNPIKQNQTSSALELLKSIKG